MVCCPKKRPDSAPYDWYKTHVLSGAQEAGFAADYTAAIAQVVAKTDLDENRRRRELQIYG
ncbi:MAG: gamma-glutamylcyclotransferase [Phenylobacterium sp.]|jgi:gamma-glutamylcyclotransferase